MTHVLRDLIKGAGILEVKGDLDVTVTSVVFDSREVEPGSVFFAIKGTRFDGHEFIDKAVEKKAVAVVGEAPSPAGFERVYVRVSDSARAFGLAAAGFYGQPSRYLKLVGVTGTNGKTTTVFLLYQLFRRLGFKVGLLSTIHNRIGDEIRPSTHTTPDALAINKALAEMVDAGCQYAFMEVSSHSLDQERVAGLEFAGAVFTNISQDHLDYHATFDAYIHAKKKLFDQLMDKAFALVNADDRRAGIMTQNSPAKVHSFALKRPAEFKAKVLENRLSGLHLQLDGYDFFSSLVGEFNAYNLLAAYGVARLLGHQKVETLQALSAVRTAEGRFEYLRDEQGGRTGVIDFAHTPDALEKVLQTLLQLRDGKGRILLVVGCGGDRDRAKRPLMGRIAGRYADVAIFTSDNPRSEDPGSIIAQMEAGLESTPSKARVLSITNRREAIRAACMMAGRGDVILVAGKGHEKYQEVRGEKLPFDDKFELQAALELSAGIKN